MRNRTRGLYKAARTAYSRYGLSAVVIVQAVYEAERALAAGGLASLGNILHQNGALGLGAAMDLNRLEAFAAEAHAQGMVRVC